jgi:hypothetical protein
MLAAAAAAGLDTALLDGAADGEYLTGGLLLLRRSVHFLRLLRCTELHYKTSFIAGRLCWSFLERACGSRRLFVQQYVLFAC